MQASHFLFIHQWIFIAFFLFNCHLYSLILFDDDNSRHRAISIIGCVSILLDNIISSVNVVVLFDALEWPWSNQTFAIVFKILFFYFYFYRSSILDNYTCIRVFFFYFFLLSSAHDHYQSAGKKEETSTEKINLSPSVFCYLLFWKKRML
jgi:hypothetical protein